MRSDPDFVYCSTTDQSRPFLEKLAAAAQAGFEGISLTIKEYLDIRSAGFSDLDLAAAVDDSGLYVAEVSTASRWLSGEVTEEEEIGVHLVSLLGAEGLNCTPLNAPYLGLDAAVVAFSAICDRAGRRGVRCQVEFLPWTQPADLQTAWEIVRLADRSNGGLIFDNWHFYRSGGALSDLRTVDPGKIFVIQLSDAPEAPEYPDLLTETAHRLLPGQGAADVVGTVRGLEEIGVAAPYGGEVINPCWASSPAVENASVLHAAMREVVAAAACGP